MTAAEYDRVPRIAPRDYSSPLAARLEELWATKPGIIGWLSSVDHKEIGLRYIVTAFIFLVVGGIEKLALAALRGERPVDLDQLAREASALHAVGTLSDRLKP